MLKVEEVHTFYGESHILQGLSLRVGEGEAVAVLGRNGAGKTTMVRSILGWTAPRSGQITFGGRSIAGLPAHQVARAGLGIVPQGRRIFPNLTVRENLELGAGRDPADGKLRMDLQRVFQLFPRLQERQCHWGNQLSGGEQSLLALGRALMGHIRMLLLDEPSEGLAPMMVREVARVLLALKREGLPVLLVEQNLGLALSVADRVYIIQKGRVVCETTPADLRANEELKQRFLGV